MVDNLRKSPSLAGGSESARRLRIPAATMVAAIPVVVGLLMLTSSLFDAEPLDHDVPEARKTAEQFATTWLHGSSAQAIRFVSDASGITVEQLERERQYFDSHDFEIVGPARFVRDSFVVGQPGYAVPLEGAPRITSPAPHARGRHDGRLAGLEGDWLGLGSGRSGSLANL
jgi:hypothetical protein